MNHARYRVHYILMKTTFDPISLAQKVCIVISVLLLYYTITVLCYLRLLAYGRRGCNESNTIYFFTIYFLQISLAIAQDNTVGVMGLGKV